MYIPSESYLIHNYMYDKSVVATWYIFLSLSGSGICNILPAFSSLRDEPMAVLIIIIKIVASSSYEGYRVTSFVHPTATKS